MKKVVFTTLVIILGFNVPKVHAVYYGTTWGDTFTQGTTVDLSAHTSTGPDNPGVAWVVQLAGGAINNTTANIITENSGGNGNRYKLNKDLETDNMEVSADFTWTGVGAFHFFGLIARLPSAIGSGAIEALYDNGVGGWSLSDTVQTCTLLEAWPGGTVAMKVIMSNRVLDYYANGVKKCSLVTTKFPGNNYAGVLLGSFDGNTAQITADNFKAIAIPFTVRLINWGKMILTGKMIIL